MSIPCFLLSLLYVGEGRKVAKIIHLGSVWGCCGIFGSVVKSRPLSGNALVLKKASTFA
jgi:hypothetical protein